MKNNENFDCFIKTVHNKPASFSVNKTFKEFNEKQDYPYIGCIRIIMNEPELNGLSSRSEYDILLSIENELVSYVEFSPDILYVGRSTSNGMRDFYIYMEDYERHIESIEKVLAQFSEYDFELGFRPDETWDVYHKFLLTEKEYN